MITRLCRRYTSACSFNDALTSPEMLRRSRFSAIGKIRSFAHPTGLTLKSPPPSNVTTAHPGVLVLDEVPTPPILYHSSHALLTILVN
jgi:predicted ATPase with chaperone activity